MASHLDRIGRLAQLFWRQLLRFPWRVTAQTLRQRFRDERLSLTAGSLTFTTLLALVPFFAVALAAFSAFPMFARLQGGLQRWLVQSLVPESISRQVLGYLSQFAAKASQLGLVGFSALVVTALALVLTVDRTFNTIWRVPRLRPLGQRLLIYWAALTLGPLLLAVSVALSSYALSASRGLVQAMPGWAEALIAALQFVVFAAAMAALYRLVPNTRVRWRHAWVGGLFVSACMGLAKKGLVWYLGAVPTYSVVYGTFATLPILLVWIYIAWVIVLLGAVMVASLPSLLGGVARRSVHPGWPFALALEVLAHLQTERDRPTRGLRALALARRMRVDVLQLESALQALLALGWIARIDEHRPRRREEPRLILLADPARTPLAPLVERLLLERNRTSEALWQWEHLEARSLADALDALAHANT